MASSRWPDQAARWTAAYPVLPDDDETSSESGEHRAPLPAWPVWSLLCLYPLWWALGVADVIVMPLAGVMALYLGARGGTRIPRSFLVWLLFIVMMLGSVIELTQGNQFFTFSYRGATYLAATVVFVYVFNAPERLGQRRVAVIATIFWLVTVAGGYLGVILPYASFRTPMYYVLQRYATGLVGNEVVNHWVVRRFSQFSATSYLGVAPRPSAPFLYTNNWGNAYSILLPIVVALLIVTTRRSGSWWLLLVMVPVSAVPAFLTLNRGMFIGLGIVGLFLALRMAGRRNFRGILVLVVIAVVGWALYTVLPIQERLQTRLQGDSTSTRASLYQQAIHSVPASPVFGYGVPLPAGDPLAPPVGTQGQIWMILVSHGAVAAVCFAGFFLVVVAASLRKRDPVSMAMNAVLFAVTIELIYYGILHTLPVLMSMAAVLLRAPTNGPPGGDVRTDDELEADSLR